MLASRDTWKLGFVVVHTWSLLLLIRFEFVRWTQEGIDLHLSTRLEILVNGWVDDGSQLTHESFVPYHVLLCLINRKK